MPPSTSIPKRSKVGGAGGSGHIKQLTTAVCLREASPQSNPSSATARTGRAVATAALFLIVLLSLESEIAVVDGLPELTPWGASIRHVFFSFLGSGFCASGNDDWRGDLPRHLVRYLPKAENIVMHGRHECRTCLDNFRNSGERSVRECRPLLKRLHSRGYKADLLVVMGSGNQQRFSSIRQALGRSFVGPDTRTVHFPIRRLAALNAETNALNFTKVIEDVTFLKPLAKASASYLTRNCVVPTANRRKDLLYIGRLRDFKGQVAFLRRVDPQLLRSYTVHFYGPGTRGARERIRRVASERNIAVRVHGAVGKLQLLQHLCQAKGVLHYAQSDINPRAAYEGLHAGLPLFITTRSGVPPVLLEQPFVATTDWGRDLNSDLAQFLPLLDVNWRVDQRWRTFVEHDLDASAIYTKICRDMGVCASSSGLRNLTTSSGAEL